MRKVRTYPIRRRKNKVRRQDFAALPKKGISFKKFWNGLPGILAGNDIKQVVDKIIAARKKNKPVIFFMGAHVIKCGMNPVIIELLKRGVISLIGLNGAGIIHDFEIAMIGETSEDVEKNLTSGSFGMAEETGALLNEAINMGIDRGKGIGSAVGSAILKSKFRYKSLSICAAAEKLNVPVTVHVAVGTDIIHQHPSCDGAALGEGSLSDFHVLTDMVAGLGNGGVVVNLGSAVVLPEVFVKALNLARNSGRGVKNFTCANFDKIDHYRPYQNIVKRPTVTGGLGVTIIGQHEIMIPLLAQAIIEKTDKEKK